KTSRRKAPQSSHHRPRSTQIRRALRDAQRRHLLPIPAYSTCNSSLTKTIEAPPPRGWSGDPAPLATSQSTPILGRLCPLPCPPRTHGVTCLAATARGGIFHPVGLGLCGTPILPSHLGNGLRQLQDSLNRLVYIRHP